MYFSTLLTRRIRPLYLSVFLIQSLALTACKNVGNRSTEDSAVKVISGVENYELAKAVIGLLMETERGTASCTGAIVRHDLILTAAHCVVDSNAKTVTPFFNYAAKGSDPFLSKNIRSSQYIAFPDYDASTVAASLGTDIAFIVFPKDTFVNYPQAKIAQNATKTGDMVTMIGYGNTGIKDPASNRELRRYQGTNKVAKVLDNAANAIFLSTSQLSNSEVGLGQGDSGGPLLNGNGEIVGVAHANGFSLPKDATLPGNSYISSENHLTSIYTNLADPNVTKFVSTIMKDGNPSSEIVKNIKGTPADGGSKKPFIKCVENKFCQAGWGWLNQGEFTCDADTAGWIAANNGCSCECK